MKQELLDKIKALVMALNQNKALEDIQVSIKDVQKALDSEEKTAFSLDEMDTIKGVLLPGLTTYSSKNNNALADSILVLKNFIQDTEGYVILNGLTSNFERTKVAQPAGAYYTYVTGLQEIINDKKGNLETSNLATDKRKALFSGDLDDSTKLIEEIIETEAVNSALLAAQYYIECNQYIEQAQIIKTHIENEDEKNLLNPNDLEKIKTQLNNITHLTGDLENDKKSLIETLDKLIVENLKQQRLEKKRLEKQKEEAARKEREEKQKKEEEAKRQQKKEKKLKKKKKEEEVKRKAKEARKEEKQKKEEEAKPKEEEAKSQKDSIKQSIKELAGKHQYQDQTLTNALELILEINKLNDQGLKQLLIKKLDSISKPDRKIKLNLTSKKPEKWEEGRGIKKTVINIDDILRCFDEEKFEAKNTDVGDDFFKVENVDEILPYYYIRKDGTAQNYLSYVVKRAILEDAKRVSKNPGVQPNSLMLNELMGKFIEPQILEVNAKTQQELMLALDDFFQAAIESVLTKKYLLVQIKKYRSKDTVEHEFEKVKKEYFEESFYKLMFLLFEKYREKYTKLNEIIYSEDNRYQPLNSGGNHALNSTFKYDSNLHNNSQLLFGIFKLMHLKKNCLDIDVENRIISATHTKGMETDLKKQLRTRFKMLTQALHNVPKKYNIAEKRAARIKKLDNDKLPSAEWGEVLDILGAKLHQAFALDVDKLHTKEKNLNEFSYTLGTARGEDSDKKLSETSDKLKKIRKHDYPNLFKEGKSLAEGTNVEQEYKQIVKK